MSDRGKDSGRDDKIEKTRARVSGGDEFGRQIAKIAVTQICESTGFHSSHHSALDALADIAIRYISNLGKAAHFYANLAGRTTSNEFDIIQGLEDLSSSHGFSSASDVHHCLVRSGVVRDLTQFVDSAKEVPFARPVPRFPIPRSLNPIPSFAQAGEEPPKKHIPEWLPAFPDPHTYVRTPVWNERASDVRADKIEQARQRRKAERSLLTLQQRLACNGTSGFVVANDSDVGKGKQVVGSNPFLAPPLPSGEKDVAEIVVPNEVTAGKRLSVLETFGPAIEAAREGPCENEDSERSMIRNRKPTVRFKIGIDKKSVALPLSSNALGARTDSWFLRDDEKDDKKRRAEMILKEAMENPQELTQL